MSFESIPGWTDLVVSGSAMRIPPAQAPTEVAWNGLRLLSFATGEYTYFEGMQLPHGYVEGSDLYPHVHFMPDSNITDGETAVWEITYTIQNVWSVYPTVSTLTLTFTNDATARAKLDAAALSGTTILPDTHLIAGNATGISGTFTLSAVMMGKLEYMASSTYGGECLLVSADTHIQIERYGSFNEFTG